MEIAKKEVNESSVTFATDQAIYRRDAVVKNALDMLADAEKKERISKSTCVPCWYLGKRRIVGHAMSTRPCGICGHDVRSANTHVGTICLRCGTANELCVDCGGDVKMRPRRKFRKKGAGL